MAVLLAAWVARGQRAWTAMRWSPRGPHRRLVEKARLILPDLLDPLLIPVAGVPLGAVLRLGWLGVRGCELEPG